jgi:sec-independent protein translocase protein TatA
MGLGLGPLEIGLVMLVVLLLFGAKRLPELAQGMGKGIRDFKRAVNGLDDASMQQANAQQNYLEAVPAPVQVPPAQPVVAQPIVAAEPVTPAQS